jgi:hypothetical protein
MAPGVSYFNYELAKFSKIPHDAAYVMPKSFSVYYNFMFIKMLEQYCDSNNIKFIWSIYEDNHIVSWIRQNPNNIFKNFLKTSDIIENFFHIEKPLNVYNPKHRNKIKEERNKKINEECDHEFKNHELYLHAADWNDKTQSGHWGIHTHYHIAEKFTNKYNEIKNDE